MNDDTFEHYVLIVLATLAYGCLEYYRTKFPTHDR